MENIFNALNIKTATIKLGEVHSLVPLTEDQKKQLEKQLSSKGFELLQDQKSKLIAQIKALIIDQVHHNNSPLNTNFSALIADSLHQEYSSLSRLFSAIEGITIERYILKQKVEKVKELLFYNELTLAEIAFRTGYSSVAHLSAQFKRETGMTVTAFKKLRKPGHQALDGI
ncbi:AraC family transcriptional regulator [Fulvivirga sp. M361]|uniref:helix-turn-helix domain-containing protein n=1 Tax=Fulvivirga sp. M361 TaxID=2594266 RepID=UPI0021028B88|nr:AraC family transcriptional regulator [Fulvivirga sp. M361]